MSDSAQFVPTRSRLLPSLAMAVVLCFGFGAAGQSSSGMGSAAADGASQGSAAGAFTGSLPNLREGMIYLLALSTLGTKRVEHFWLCGRCSRSMVFMRRNESGAQITLRPQRHQDPIDAAT